MAQIESVAIHSVGTPVRLRYGCFETQFCSALIIEISAEGETGWGECGARNWRFLNAKKTAIKIARTIIGRDPSDPSRSLMRNPAGRLETDWWSLGYNRQLRTIREGFSIAMHDLAAKLRNQSVVTMLGGPLRETVPGMPVVHYGPPSDMAQVAAVWAHEFGYRFLKLKLSADHRTSCEQLEAVRSAIGSSPGLQVDFNYSFKQKKQAVLSINDLHDRFRLDIAEDPIRPFLEIYPYPGMNRRIHPRLMIDGVAYWPNVKRLIKHSAARVFNQHTDMQGGLDLALLIGRYASQRGVDTAIGSAGLVGIQDRAFQTLSALVGLSRPCESIGFYKYGHERFDDYYGVPADLNISGEIPETTDGNVHVNPLAPGFGFDINRQRLAQLTCAEKIQIHPRGD